MEVRQKIVRFYQDEEDDWVAKMACGHTQHMRHNPPWQNRPWIATAAGRNQWIGTSLTCKDCTQHAEAQEN